MSTNVERRERETEQNKNTHKFKGSEIILPNTKG